MDDVRAVIIDEYEKLISGQKEKIEYTIFEHSGNSRLYSEENEKRLRLLLLYVFESRMHWTPMAVKNNLTLQMLTDLKLRHLIRYILRIPYEANVFFGEPSYDNGRRRQDDGLDPGYIVSFAYPHIFPYSKRQEIEKLYSKIMSGETEVFPHGYFVRNYHEVYNVRYGRDQMSWNGSSTEYERAGICFAKALKDAGIWGMNSDSIREFLGTKAGGGFVRRRRLLRASRLYASRTEFYDDACFFCAQTPFLTGLSHLKPAAESLALVVFTSKNSLNSTALTQQEKRFCVFLCICSKFTSGFSPSRKTDSRTSTERKGGIIPYGGENLTFSPRGYGISGARPQHCSHFASE